MPNKDNYGAEIGKRITCQICGNHIFLAQIGYNTMDAAEADRHSFYDCFEPVPESWDIKHDLGGWLCPSCIENYNSMIQKLKSNRKEGADNGILKR